MSGAPIVARRRVATYERVSSEDQRERETIRTQTDELARRLEREPDMVLIERYADDGVSGTIPLAERPAGGRLMRDAAAGRFDELWVYKLDRLGRDAVDLLVVRRRLIELGIRLLSVVEAEPDLLSYDVQAVIADHARREFLRRSADGLNRAAREGRYTGGIVPYGYRVEGKKPHARLVPDEAPLWGDCSAASVVRRIYTRLALDGWSCRRVADELNALGIPPHYARDGRGVRGRRTRGVWRAGRIRNLVVEPTYRGELHYGRRTARRERAVIVARLEPLVSEELWQAAQEALARNRLIPKNTPHVTLLAGVIHCAIDGLAFTTSQGRGGRYYRCDGRIHDRGPLEGRCPSRYVRADWLEAIVWQDVARWLRDPGDALAALAPEAEREAAAAVVEAESITLTRALERLDAQRRQALALNIRGRLPDEELDAELDRIGRERAEIARRIAALTPADLAEEPASSVDLLAQIRQRLDGGLTEEERHEIVRLLASVVVHSDVQPDGTTGARVVVRYRFPGGVSTRTGTGSSPPRAGPGPGTVTSLEPAR